MKQDAVSLRPVLTRPRRIATAVAVFLLFAAVPVAFGGVTQQVEMPRGDLPATFEVAPMWDGDVANYSRTFYEVRDGERRPVDVMDDALRIEQRFHWLPIDGHWIQVHEAREVGEGGCVLNGVVGPAYLSSLFASNGTLLGAGSGCDHRDRPVEEEPEGWGRRVLTKVSESMELPVLEESDHYGSAHECVHRNAFQGDAIPLDDLEGLFEHCYLIVDPPNGPSRYLPVHGEVFEVVGIAESDSESGIVVQATPPGGSDPARIQWWFLPSSPYPVRVSVDLPDQGVLMVYELERLNRGEPPGDTPPLVPAAPQRHPWGFQGPAERDIDHPFPLSQALKVTEEHPDFDGYREFVKANPRAVVQKVGYSSDHADQQRDSWSFVLSDGSSHGAFSVTRYTSLLLPEFLQHHTGLDGPSGEPEYMLEERPLSTSQGLVKPSDLPAVPAVEDLYRLYEALTGETASAWGFQSCVAPCRPHQLMVGQFHTEEEPLWQDDDLLMASGRNNTQVHDFMFVTPEGTLVSRDKSIVEDRYGPDAMAPVEEPDRFEQELTPAGLDASMAWQLPTAVAAGSVVVGLLLALVYWVSPVVKATPAVLFSRVKRDRLLENPHRRAIMEAVESRPGTHYRELVRTLDLPGGTVKHHLDKLVHGGLVTATPGQGYTCYAPRGRVDHATIQSRAVLKSPVAWALLETLRNEDGTTAKEAADRLGVTPPTVHHHLDRLERAGLVRRMRAGRRVRLVVTPSGQQATWE